MPSLSKDGGRALGNGSLIKLLCFVVLMVQLVAFIVPERFLWAQIRSLFSVFASWGASGTSLKVLNWAGRQRVTRRVEVSLAFTE